MALGRTVIIATVVHFCPWNRISSIMKCPTCEKDGYELDVSKFPIGTKVRINYSAGPLGTIVGYTPRGYLEIHCDGSDGWTGTFIRKATKIFPIA